MTGHEVTTQARATERSEQWEALKSRERLRALPMSEAVERARAAALARQLAPGGSGKMAVPLALKTALQPHPLTPSPREQPQGRGTVAAPAEKTPTRQSGRKRGASPLGALVKGMIRAGVATKEDSRFAYASGKNYMDRQVPPEREIERETSGEVEG